MRLILILIKSDQTARRERLDVQCSLTEHISISERDFFWAVARKKVISDVLDDKQQLFDRGSDARKRTGGMEVLLR